MKEKLYNLKTFSVVYQVYIMQALQQDYIKQLNEDAVYHSIARAIKLLLKYVYMLPFLLLADHHIVLSGKHILVESHQ